MVGWCLNSETSANLKYTKLAFKLATEGIIQFASIFSGIFAVWVGRKYRPILWYYVLSSFVFDINGFVLKFFTIEWRWGSNMFFLTEFVLVSLFFIHEVFPPKYRNASLLLLFLISSYFAAHTTVNSIVRANYADAAILYGIFIFYSIFGLTKVIKEIEFVMVEHNPLFIFSVAFLLYSSGIFIIFLFENKLIYLDRKLINNLWAFVHNPLNIIKNIMIGYGLIMINKSRWHR